MRTNRGQHIGKRLLVMVLATTLVIPGFTRQSHALSLPDDRGFHIIIDGTHGENGWYVSPVTFSFFVDGGFRIFYSINGGTYLLWEGFPIKLFDSTVIGYYAEDEEGTLYGPYYEQVNIDLDSPSVIECRHISLNEVAIAALANDTTSGINRVEFYLRYGSSDWTLMKIDMTPLYCLILNPIPREHNVEVMIIAYDNAGNSGVPSNTTTYPDLTNVRGFVLNPIYSTNGTVSFQALFTICNPGGLGPPYLLLPTQHTITSCDGDIKPFWVDIYY